MNKADDLKSYVRRGKFNGLIIGACLAGLIIGAVILSITGTCSSRFSSEVMDAFHEAAFTRNGHTICYVPKHIFFISYLATGVTVFSLAVLIFFSMMLERKA